MGILPKNTYLRLFLYFAVCTFALWYLVFSFSSKVKDSTLYKDAIRVSSSHPDVIRALGEPIEAGTFVSGSLDEDLGTARLKFSLSGPNARGTLYVGGEADDGQWSIKTIVLETSEERLDLLQKTSN